MIQFKRYAKVAVGPPGEEGVSTDKLRISFEIYKTALPSANEINVSVYNLSETSRAAMERVGNRLILAAGYEGDLVRVLGLGDITSYETAHSGTGDVVTSFTCGDGVTALRNARISISYSGQVSLSTILGDVTQALGLDAVDVFFPDTSASYRNGYSFSGQAMDALKELSGRFGFEFSVQNGELKILGRRAADTRDIVRLTPQTGLIYSPTPIDDLGIHPDKDQKTPGLSIMCQLQPRLYPGGAVELQSRKYNGIYRIETVTHSGDTHGQQWQTVAEVRELA